MRLLVYLWSTSYWLEQTTIYVTKKKRGETAYVVLLRNPSQWRQPTLLFPSVRRLGPRFTRYVRRRKAEAKDTRKDGLRGARLPTKDSRYGLLFVSLLDMVLAIKSYLRTV